MSKDRDSIVTALSPETPDDYAPTSDPNSLTQKVYVSTNNSELADTVALFRTIFAGQLYSSAAFSFNSIFARAEELDSKHFKKEEALRWLSQNFQSYKEYHDLQGCGVLPTPPPPQCYLSGPTQVPKGSPARLELHAYGEFTSVVWDGDEYSEEADRSTIGKSGFIEDPKEMEFIKERYITTADGKINSEATVKLVVNGTTQATTCKLGGGKAKSVTLNVVAPYPKLSSLYVPNNNKAASLGYSPSFNFQYQTTNMDSPKCTIVSNDPLPHVYTSDLLTDETKLVNMGPGIDDTTVFKITCTDADKTKVSTTTTARIFPAPECCMTGCAAITIGQSAPFSLNPAKFPDKADWGGTFDSHLGTIPTFPVMGQSISSGQGQTLAVVKSPGGTSECGTSIQELALPPPICTSVSAPTATDPGATATSCVPAPIPPPSNCQTWCSVKIDPCDLPGADPCKCQSPPPASCDPCNQTGADLCKCPNPPASCRPPQSCMMVVDTNNKYNCPHKDGLTYVQVYIPALKRRPSGANYHSLPNYHQTPVIDLYYGKNCWDCEPARRKQDGGHCTVPQPPRPPPTYTHTDGTVYSLAHGAGAMGLGSKDCPAVFFNHSPLMIDLNNQGIEFSSAQEGAEFDLEGNGEKDLHSWPLNPGNSVFLAYDRNEDGLINDVGELFGNKTVGPDGEDAANGFEALKKYDHNGDRTLNAQDAVFSKLRVWFPYSKNGKLRNPSQLKRLSAVGIRAIDLKYLEPREIADIHGNLSRQHSTVEMEDQTRRPIIDIWLR